MIATKSAYLHDAIRLSSLNPAVTPQQDNAPTTQNQSRVSSGSQQPLQPPSPPPQQQSQSLQVEQQQQPQVQVQQDEFPPSPPHGETGKKSLGKQLKSLFQVKK